MVGGFVTWGYHLAAVLQSISFLKDRRGRSIAYARFGRGRPLVCDTGFISHLEAQWEYPPYRRFFEALAVSHDVIRFDLPGIGLGDRADEVVEFEDDIGVLEDLVDGLGLEDFDLFGASQAAVVMVAYAARHPERVGRLVLFGGYALGATLSPPDVQQALLRLVSAHWGVASRTLADIFVRGGDEAAHRAWARVTRLAASREAAVRRLEECFSTDVRAELSQVCVPTLVMHRRGDVNVRVEHGRDLAAGISGAKLVLLEGQSHIWYVGDMESVLAPMLEFLGDKRRAPRKEGELSRREGQVAALIAAGLTNAEIGARLAISERTAEAHAEHIRNKLGFRSRAQIAAWAVDNVAAEVGIAP
jgi:pimeloyl-ACP methyl ester carboxylesterase/DNA-binding CsgD family transcriptional regulator